MEESRFLEGNKKVQGKKYVGYRSNRKQDLIKSYTQHTPYPGDEGFI